MDEKQFQPPYYYNEEDDGISMLDILIILAERKKMIIAVTLIFLLGGLAYGFFFTKAKYMGEVQVMPVSSAIVNKGTYNVYVSGNIISGIATSNAALDAVIDKFGLLKRDDKNVTRKQARAKLKKDVKVKYDDKTGVISITADADSPQQAADMANYVYDITEKSLKELAMVAVVDNNTALLGEELSKIKAQGGFAGLDTKTDDGMARIVELYSTLTQYDDSKQLKNKTPVVLQLIAPASVPDEKEAQGRGKIAVLSAILGLFVGITLAFVCNFWQTAEDDPETKEKKARLRALLGRKSA
ncbi:MAG: Wzz/FepE/Etk N-terminal domain-containing protein [Cloacibacillus sp.]